MPVGAEHRLDSLGGRLGVRRRYRNRHWRGKDREWQAGLQYTSSGQLRHPVVSPIVGPAVIDAKERRKVPAFVRILALMSVRQLMLETLHRGLIPITRIGDYSAVVVNADGRRIPWTEVSRFGEDEMRDLMQEIVTKLYTFFVKAEDPDFKA